LGDGARIGIAPDGIVFRLVCVAACRAASESVIVPTAVFALFSTMFKVGAARVRVAKVRAVKNFIFAG